jgi:folate-binding protein YgfZ
MKRGSFFELQSDAGAEFGVYDGWELPTSYGSPGRELAILKASVGLVDLSGWGVLKLTGENRLDFVHRMSTNAVSALTPGQGAPTVFTTPVGRIVDLAYVLPGEGSLLLLVGRGAVERVADWLKTHVFFNDDVAVADETEALGLAGLAGPNAVSLVADLAGESAGGLTPNHSMKVDLRGVEATLVRATPLGIGFLLIAQAGEALALWSVLSDAVVEAGGGVVGESAVESFRVGQGWPRYGRELSEAYIPLEAGLRAAVSFDKGCYVGQEIIARMDTYGRLAKRLVVLGTDNGGLNVQEPVWKGETRVGQVTSVAPLADDGAFKALAYVKTAAAIKGQTLSVGEQGACQDVTVLEMTDVS